MLDHAKINVRGGSGGAGSASFRREKHVPKGGPDGGDGGRGGDVYLEATRQIRDLSPFRQKVHVRAGNGGHGQGGNKRGRDGDDAVVEVPVGTEVYLEGALLADLVLEGQRVLVADGGEGGRGNVCFVSSTRRAPHFAEKGLPGEERWIELTLKLLADVGFAGLPNAGKSSLLAALTRARPKIAPYPFTTLEPNLGTLLIDDRQIVLADIPGLVEGASAGVGLGDRFLAHIERTAVLLYVVDATAGPEAALVAARTVRDELAAFSPALVAHPALCALNKVDLVADDGASAALAALEEAGLGWAEAPLPTSAVTGSGLEELVAALGRALGVVEPPPAPAPAPAVLQPGADRVRAFTVAREGEVYRVTGVALERLVAKTELSNDEAVRYLQEVMERAGVSDALRRAGAQPGDAVVIGGHEFEFA
jgi:GTP-binding protein